MAGACSLRRSLKSYSWNCRFNNAQQNTSPDASVQGDRRHSHSVEAVAATTQTVARSSDCIPRNFTAKAPTMSANREQIEAAAQAIQASATAWLANEGHED